MKAKYSKSPKYINNEFDDSETLNTENATNKNVAQHPTIDDTTHMVTDAEMETITNSVQFMADVYKGFTKMFCDDDGILIDLTDKAGRERDRQFMLSLQSRLDASIQRMEQDMQRHYTAEFLPKDRKMFETVNANFQNARSWVLGTCFIGAVIFIAGIFLCFNSFSRESEMEKQLEQLRNEQTEIAAFGSYVKEKAPNVYKGWKAILTAEKDSVKTASQR